MNKIRTYPGAYKLLHWTMAFIILSMLFLGVAMVQSLDTWQHTAIGWHQSFGFLVFVLVIVRLLSRLWVESPPLPADLSMIQVFAAKASHILLYAFMLAMPLLGWLMQNANGLLVEPFGLFHLPALVSQDLALYGLFRTLHGYAAMTFFAFIVVHIGAALFHGWVRRDGVLQHMLFKSK